MSRPLSVVLDLTSRCNLRCVMCYFSGVDKLSFAPHDRSLSPEGHLPLETFEKIARELFPRAWRVALGCAAEPLIHPEVMSILEVTGLYRVPDLWFPTNLLALTEKKAEALIKAGVSTLGVSVDGMRKETYEKIRVGGSWDRLLQRLRLLAEVKKAHRATRPRVRIIFTWMQSNREELQELPAFAVEHGAREIDVRFVTPTVGVDVSLELLSDEEPALLRQELASAAREAVKRGLELSSYPEFETERDRPSGIVGRVRRRLWRIRAGVDRWEYIRHLVRERMQGCAHPGRTYVIRPNGAVYPCTFWEEDPIAFFPEQGFHDLESSRLLGEIGQGLREGRPVGTCDGCSQRRDAFYRPLRQA